MPLPFTLYKGEAVATDIYPNDLDQWLLDGWSTEKPLPTSSIVESLVQPQDPTPTANSEEEELKKLRKDELLALYQTQGWGAIAKAAQPLGIKKPATGWDDAIDAIVAAEFAAG